MVLPINSSFAFCLSPVDSEGQGSSSNHQASANGQDILSYAQFQQQHGNLPEAMAIFSQLTGDPLRTANDERQSTAEIPDFIQRQAQSATNAITGQGGFTTARAEFLSNTLIEQIFDPVALGAMVGAGLTYRVARFGIFQGAARFGFSGAWLRPAASLGAFAFEASAFPLYGNLGSLAMGRLVDWNQFPEQVASSFLILGGLKSFGYLGHRAQTWAHGSQLRMNGSLFQQATLYLGIVSGHGAEQFFKLSQEQDPGQLLVESLATLIHFNAAGRLLPFVGGSRRQNFEQNIERQWQNPSRPSLFPQWAEAGVAMGPKNSPERFRPQFPMVWMAQGSRNRGAAIPLSAEARIERWEAMAQVLETHSGTVSKAARALRMSEANFHYWLEMATGEAPKDSPIRSWLWRLSPSGRGNVRRRKWANFTRALARNRGQFELAARELGVSSQLLHRFFSEVISNSSHPNLEPHYRKVILASLAPVLGNSRKLLRFVENSSEEDLRLVVLQNIYSQGRATRAALSRVAQSDPSQRIREAALSALQLTRGQRVLLALGTNTQPKSINDLFSMVRIPRKNLGRMLSKLAYLDLVSRIGEDFQINPRGRRLFLYHRQLNLGDRVAPPPEGIPLDPDTSVWLNRWNQMSQALDRSKGVLAQAARDLQVSETTFYGRLEKARLEAPHDAAIQSWVEKLSPEGRRISRRRLWLNFTQTLMASGGIIGQAAKCRGVSHGVFTEFINRVTSLERAPDIDTYFRRVLLSNLAQALPVHPRVLNVLRHHSDDTLRLVLAQSLLSQAKRTQEILQSAAEGDPSPLVRFAAERSHSLSRVERIVLILFKTHLNFSDLEFARLLGLRRQQFNIPLRDLLDTEALQQTEEGTYGLTDRGREFAKEMWLQGNWDHLNRALELTEGHQGRAAALLGVSRQTLNKQLQASLGRVPRNGSKGNHILDPKWRAPLDHPLWRWGWSDYISEIRLQRRRERRRAKFQPLWEFMARELERALGNFTEVAALTNSTTERVRSHIRMAEDCGFEALGRWADPDYVAGKHRERRERIQATQREQHRRFWEENSPLKDLSASELGDLYRAGDRSEELKQEFALRFQFGDSSAGNYLLAMSNRFVEAQSRARHWGQVELDDLLQVGREGVLEAARRFDPSRKAQFLTYASYWILSRHVNLIQKNIPASISGRDLQLILNMRSLRRDGLQQGLEMDAEQIAAGLGVSVEKVRELQMMAQSLYVKSFDQPINGDEGLTYEEVVSSRENILEATGFQEGVLRSLNQFLQIYRIRNGHEFPTELLSSNGEEIKILAKRQGRNPEELQAEAERLRNQLHQYLATQGLSLEVLQELL